MITRAFVKRALLGAVGALACDLASCRSPGRPDVHEEDAPSATATASATVSVSSTAPESAPPSLEPLAVPGFGDALVALPAPGRRALVVVTHGHGEAPEGICALFTRLVARRAYVLCLRGTLWPISQIHTYEGEQALGRELDAAIAALAAAHPDLDREGAVYAGFSMGATFGVSALVARAGRFSRLVLVEGGITDWSAGRIAAFAHSGGELERRVLFAVGRAVKVPQAEAIVRAMKAAALDARVVFGVDESGAEYGHGWDGPVAEQIAAALPWLLAGDARFAP